MTQDSIKLSDETTSETTPVVTSTTEKLKTETELFTLDRYRTIDNINFGISLCTTDGQPNIPSDCSAGVLITCRNSGKVINSGGISDTSLSRQILIYKSTSNKVKIAIRERNTTDYMSTVKWGDWITM